jgi:hypothetical protein
MGATVIRSLMKSVLALTLGAMVVVLPSTAAHAASGVALTPPATINGNTAEDCYSADYGYAVAPDTAVASWTLDVTVTRPDGSLEGGDLFSDSDLPTGTGSQTLCPYSDAYGTYTITGTLTTMDDSYNTLEVLPSSTTFRYVGPAHSVTSMTLSGHRLYAGHPLKMKLHAMRAGTGWAHAKIRIEMRVYGLWTKLRVVRTGPTGRITLTLTPKPSVINDPVMHGHTFRFRAVTSDATFTYGDNSPSQKLRFG